MSVISLGIMDACSAQLKANELKQVIIVNSDLKMRKGKVASQVAHAAVKAAVFALEYYPDLYIDWNETGHKKVVVTATEKEMRDITVNPRIPTAVIVDQGLTQIPPNSLTTIAFGPWNSDELDAITAKFKLVN